MGKKSKPVLLSFTEKWKYLEKLTTTTSFLKVNSPLIDYAESLSTKQMFVEEYKRLTSLSSIAKAHQDSLIATITKPQQEQYKRLTSLSSIAHFDDIFKKSFSLNQLICPNPIVEFYERGKNLSKDFSLVSYNHFSQEDDEENESEEDYEENESEEDSKVILNPNKELIIADANIIHDIKKDPNIIYEISPYLFEEIIAELFKQQGYEVELTQKSRDGGKDIYLRENKLIGRFLYFVECKRFGANKKVGVSFVRQLYGVVQAKKATAGILVTTSSFTKDAKEFQQEVAFQISLKDYQEVQKWINKYN